MADLADEDHGLVRLDLKSMQLCSEVTIEEVQVDENYDAIVSRREVYSVIHGFPSTVNLGESSSVVRSELGSRLATPLRMRHRV
jgi:hypothetical protein